LILPSGTAQIHEPKSKAEIVGAGDLSRPRKNSKKPGGRPGIPPHRVRDLDVFLASSAQKMRGSWLAAKRIVRAM
jgi:hypothetical protein